MSREIQRIADALRDEKVQEYVQDRPTNEVVEPVRDLLREGSKYANKKSAFSKYRANDSSMENMGYQEVPVAEVESEDDDTSYHEPEYLPTDEDLAVDDEEPEITDTFIEAAVTMVNDILE
ncbi:hypothetical protein PM082_018350 [Marasmius tenuissimus]|nr:hypothetical protein PM082_018350 [Marasmius tenuissimus]